MISGSSIYMEQRKTSIANFPKMILGSSGFDGGHLILSHHEKKELIASDPTARKFVRRFMSGDDFLNGRERYCLWIDDELVQAANSINLIRERIEKCRQYRLTGGRDARKAATVPHRFFYCTHKDDTSIIFPKTTSGRREYVPLGFTAGDTIVSNASFVVYDVEYYLFGVLSSLLHNKWLSITSARMRNDYRYSVNLTYNTFPFPPISEQRKDEITQCVFRILDEREKYSERTLAQLYGPDKMPIGLREAHRENDRAVERCYRNRPFASDEDRLEYLFRLYEKMIAEEQERNTLFEKPKKIRRKKVK